MLLRLIFSLGAFIALLASVGPGSAQGAAASATATATPVAGGQKYVFPVQPVSVPRFGPYHPDYPATDIFCPVGSRFVAPTNGVVDYLSIVDKWDPKVDDPATRGGLSVAIIGDD